MSVDNDYYAILGVQPDADEDDVRRAFRERVRACHPDRVANLDADLRRLAEEKMVQLNKAYAVLRNPARRAAYDERREARAAATASEQTETERSAGSPSPAGPHGSSAASAKEASTRPGRPHARGRMADQTFVTRAATEEFTSRLKQAVRGSATWTPVALSGVTLALRASHGRTDDYFILLAAPNLDRRTLRRFLRLLESWSGKLKGKWFGRERVYPFAGAMEFDDVEALLETVERYNRTTENNRALAPATLVDLVDWNVEPGTSDLSVRLSKLLE